MSTEQELEQLSRQHLVAKRDLITAERDRTARYLKKLEQELRIIEYLIDKRGK